MGTGLSRLEDLQSDLVTTKVEEIQKGYQNEDIKTHIIKLDKELEKFDYQRNLINSLKIEKDEHIKQYINETSFPNKLEIKYLNYKALLFYFIENFTYANTDLHYDKYNNNISGIQKNKKDSFINLFKRDLPIKINVNINNFPHLIGYKDDEDEKTTKDQFIKNILYESNLSHDYIKDGCKINKIEAFAWILETLKKPLFIYDRDGINPVKSKLKADLIFIRKKNGIYHYVSLKAHQESIDNQYYINSHHYMTHIEYTKKYYQNKKIYIYNF